MSTFALTPNPTPFGIFDSDLAFQRDADSMVVFVKRKLGDDVLSVELTKKQIWACFEEAVLEYSRLILEWKIKQDLINVLGTPTGSSGSVDLSSVYLRQTLEFLLRQSEAYSSAGGYGGSYNLVLGYFNLKAGVQDYDIYSDLYRAEGPDANKLLISTLPSGSQGKIRVFDVMHFEPLAAQQFLLNASNITNFLATNFNYESYVNSTVFYVLPVFEDVLRRGMLEEAFRVRRSHYSYQITGTKLRIYPMPVNEFMLGHLYVRVMPPNDPQNPSWASGSFPSGSYKDPTMGGVSSPANAPYGVLKYKDINAPGRQWIFDYCMALCKELLGLIRSKFDSIPIPNSEVRLNGEALVSQAREDKAALIAALLDFLTQLSRQNMMEVQASIADNTAKTLRYIPIPKLVWIG